MYYQKFVSWKKKKPDQQKTITQKWAPQQPEDTLQHHNWTVVATTGKYLLQYFQQKKKIGVKNEDINQLQKQNSHW